MPEGMSVRIFKKRYKRAVKRLADSIPLAFHDKEDKRGWIREVVRNRMELSRVGREKYYGSD